MPISTLISIFQRQMFKCGYDCLDDKNSVKQAEKCIDDCGRPIHKAMNVVQNEVNSFQVSRVCLF